MSCFGLASEMLLSSFFLSSSLCVLVNYLVVVELHLLLRRSTPESRCLLVLRADVMSIPQGLQILKAI
jgi:hypothetical protein